MTSKGKVVLIKPKNVLCDNFQYPPLGLISMGNVLVKKGYEVKIIDASIDSNYNETIAKECRDALIVGISILTAEIKNAIDACEIIKSKCKVPIVIGGWHATLLPIQTCQDSLVDFVVYGEGEETLPQLIEEIKGNKHFNKIKGLVYKKNDKVIMNPPSDIVNLDKLPLVDYSLVEVGKYVKKVTLYEQRRVLPYESSRGCPYRCSFCINAVTGNQRYRKKTVNKVLDEVETLVKKWNLNFISFIDDNFFVDIKRAKEICEGIIKRDLKIKWFAECRANYFKKGFVDIEFLKLAKDAGLVVLTIGIESGSDKTLKEIKKDITVNDALQSARYLKEVGITPNYSFITGFPNEKKEDILKTFSLLSRLSMINKDLIGDVNTFRPYPKCELCEDLVKKGLFKEPAKFREWVEDKNIKIYTQRNYKQVWQTEPELIKNAAYYGSLFLSYSPNQRTIYLKSIKIKYFPHLFFVKLAEIRIKALFFGIPLDRYLYDIIKRLRQIATIFKRNK